jgi:2-oxoisovalerate dehydrogenase E2 component (dihydrolipoyl transacylase)
MKNRFFSSQTLAEVSENGIVDIPLAQTGEGIAECELLKWFVNEGDQVEEYQLLCEVQSDKATIEITSRYQGTVSSILHAPGDIVKVGETLLKMAVTESTSAEKKTDSKETLDAVISAIPDSDLDADVASGVLTTPAVRNLAKQHGIDLKYLVGSGTNGRILKEDILKFISAKDTKAPEVPAPRPLEYEDKKLILRGYQRAMVKSMTAAAKIPHFHYVDEIHCDALVELKASFKKDTRNPDVKHTFLPTLIKSLSNALKAFPLINSSFNEETHEVTLKGAHNIGIAMATPNGLVVPTIKKVQDLSIMEITKELSRLQQQAVANKLSPEDISGGTITLSNIGAIGGKFGSPLINSPEVCIIAFGKIQKVARFDDDGTAFPLSIMTANIAADHRVLDGATIARFCNEWKLFIEKPEMLVLHSR